MNENGFEAECCVAAALALLAEGDDEDSVVRDFVWACSPDAKPAEESLDGSGIDFLVFLRLPERRKDLPDFIPFLLQVKRSSGALDEADERGPWEDKPGKSLKEQIEEQMIPDRNLKKHYETYPYVFALGVDDRSPEEVAEYLDDIIRRFLNGEEVVPPGYPETSDD